MTTITIEHLELAALAAGKRVAAGYVTAHDNLTAIVLESGEEWRPHTDIAEAARLAVRLLLEVTIYEDQVIARSLLNDEWTEASHDGTEPDKLRAWCEAVTLCAAEIGRRMREGGR